MRLGDNEMLARVATRRELVEWLAEAESRVRFGRVCVNYADGRIVSYEVCHRESTAVGDGGEGRVMPYLGPSGTEAGRDRY